MLYNGPPLRPFAPGKIFFLCLVFLSSAVMLFSLGKKEEAAAAEPRDPLWTLVVTSFDTSTLSPSHTGLAEIIMREFVDNIEKVSYRVRVAEEYAYYESVARSRDLAAVAGALANKRNERDQLIYRGDAAWRYRGSIKNLDKEIALLEENYRKALAAQRVITPDPAFTLARENLDGQFPEPPQGGGEYRFCQNQSADAFVTGNMSEYHGRIFITYKLYVRYTNSYVYEDSTIFSPEDSSVVMDEFAGRLSSVVAGVSPARLRLSAQPEDALVLVNRAYAGRGEAAEREYPPGKITLEVSADHHEDVKAELELRPGEATNVTVNLRPLKMTTLRITDPLRVGVSLYSGSLYVGQAPLTLDLSPDQLAYIHAESVDGKESNVVLLTPSLNILPRPVRSSSGFFPDQSLFKNSLRGNEVSLYTSFPYDAEAKQVDKARSGYYWAWGGTWISAIAAWMINGYANSIIDSYNSNTNTDPLTVDARYDTAKRAQYLNTAGISLVGAAILLQSIQMTRYINTAGKDAPSYVD